MSVDSVPKSVVRITVDAYEVQASSRPLSKSAVRTFIDYRPKCHVPACHSNKSLWRVLKKRYVYDTQAYVKGHLQYSPGNVKVRAASGESEDDRVPVSPTEDAL